MNERFIYRSRTRSVPKLCIIFGILAVASLAVWRFTDFLGPGDPLRDLGLWYWALISGLVSLHYALEWLRPVLRESWIRDGAFGWRCPRCRPSGGEVQLADVVALRLNTTERHFTLVLRAGGLISIPEQVVQDALHIARKIVARHPTIELYVDGIKAA